MDSLTKVIVVASLLGTVGIAGYAKTSFQNHPLTTVAVTPQHYASKIALNIEQKWDANKISNTKANLLGEFAENVISIVKATKTID